MHLGNPFFFVIVRKFFVVSENVQLAGAFVETHHCAYLLSDARGDIIAERSLSLLLIFAPPPAAFQAFPLFPRISPLVERRTETTWPLWRAYQRANLILMPISTTLSYSCKTLPVKKKITLGDFGWNYITHFDSNTSEYDPFLDCNTSEYDPFLDWIV